MHITEVRIKLMDEPGERLRAFCSITFDDCFVIRDLKIIEGTNGMFVAMPSRKLTAHCGACGMKNHLRARFCNQCGARLDESRVIKDADGRAKLYADIAHPINSRCREMIQSRVVAEYRDELERAKSPDYVSRYDDYDAGDIHHDDDSPDPPQRRFDNAHAPSSDNRPHHPPEGQANNKSGGHRPSTPHSSQSERAAANEPANPTDGKRRESMPGANHAGDGNANAGGDNAGNGDASGFGAGIF